MRVALVHDYLLNYGGAERVLSALCKIYPEADIFTLLYDEKLSKYFPKDKVKTSFLDGLPYFLKKNHKFLLPLLPIAVESFDLSDYDIVISSSSVFAKGVVTNPGTVHICYCHSPARFLWDYNERYLKDEKNNALFKPFIKYLIHKARIWDRSSSERVDVWIANSKVTQERIKKYYKKDAVVIHPPVKSLNCRRNDLKIRDYFLVVSRLSPYKKIDLIINAFNELGLPLVVVGGGRDKKRLQMFAENNIVFTDFVPDAELACYYQNCKAFVMAQEEDFGIAPLEAMNFGKPVLAYKRGGAEEWLKEGVNGEFFLEQTKESLKKGIEKIEESISKYDKNKIRESATGFNFEIFKEKIENIVSQNMDKKNDA
ncbi:glycosyltransferase [Candidatus Azambacteria bacterium]|nr:glycosyltransferase [Candidatus Azambacteria bacterium]